MYPGKVERRVKNKKIFTATLTILVVRSFKMLIANQPSISACFISLGKKNKFDMEISPKIPLFHLSKDGYFYPDSPKIAKY
jgi:hypothetical protein